MKKTHLILLIIFGIFLIPNNTLACGSKKHSSGKEIVAPMAKDKSCCNSDENSDSNGCESSCGHSNCGCISTCTTSSSSILIQFKNNNVFNFLPLKKVNFHYTILSLLKGYSSIWLIPKIS